MNYQPIEDYGLIGNMRTTALVGLNGSIDWFCHPRHDSPSIFGAILDGEKGGHFKIESTVKEDHHKQFYYPETNVLITRFLCDCGVGEVVDFMPLGNSRMRNWIVRQVRTVRREITFHAECYPAFDYARAEHTTKEIPNGVAFECDRDPCQKTRPSHLDDNSDDVECQHFELITNVPLQKDGNGAVAKFTLREGENAVFIFRPVSQSDETEAIEDLNQAAETFFPRNNPLLERLAISVRIQRDAGDAG